MTRKALRKRRRQQSRTAPWITATAFVASAAFTGLRPAPVWAGQAAQARAPQPPAPQFFSIPAGPLDDALRAFQQASGVTVALAIDGIGSIHSPGAAGVFTPEQALRAIVANTGVTFHMAGPGTAVLELASRNEVVEVTGGLPLVESPKYALPVRDVPQTIAVIPKETLEEQGVRTLSEAVRNVPGITLQAGEGGGASSTAGDMFTMRGFSAANSLFVDGVRDDGLISRDVFNLEQVEVFLGPTGSDVGRGTAAGYVNMESKTPGLRPVSSAVLGYGNADQKRLTFDVGHAVPLGSASGWLGHTAVRLNGLWQDSGVPGRDLVDLGSKAIAPAIAFGLGTPTRVNVSAEILREQNVPDYGVPGAAWVAQPLTPSTVTAPSAVSQSNYYGSAGYDYDDASEHNYTARVEHDVNPRLSLRTQARYNDTYRNAVITSIANVASYDPATHLVTLSRQGSQRENTIFSEQSGLTDRFSALGLRHALTAGVEYTAETQFAPTIAGVGTRAPVDIFSPNPYDPVTGYAVTRTGASTTGKTNTIAGYAFDAIDLTSRWQLTGGLRAEHYDTRYLAVDATGAATTDQSARDVLVSGKAGLLFRVGPTANVYASYSTTATPPGTANFTLSAQGNNQNNPDVKPQRSTNYEVGSKWDFKDGRLSLTTALFRTLNKNVIYTVDATAVPPIYNQDDGQRVNGVTVGATGRVTDQWSVMASFSYLDTALETQAAANNGNRLTLTPPHSGSLWTTYRLTGRLTAGGGVRFTDSVFINAANTIQSPGYQLLDGLVQYDVNERLTLRFNGYNLTNQLYIRNVNNNGSRYNPGNPRSGVLTAAVRF